jgi:hypothetical protein
MLQPNNTLTFVFGYATGYGVSFFSLPIGVRKGSAITIGELAHNSKQSVWYCVLFVIDMQKLICPQRLPKAVSLRLSIS